MLILTLTLTLALALARTPPLILSGAAPPVPGRRELGQLRQRPGGPGLPGYADPDPNPNPNPTLTLALTLTLTLTPCAESSSQRTRSQYEGARLVSYVPS